MKETLHALLFALLFSLTVLSIGLSAHSMLRTNGQWTQPRVEAGSALRTAAPVRPRLTGTPVPAPSLRHGRAA